MSAFDKYKEQQRLRHKATRKNKRHIVNQMERTFELYKEESPTCILAQICEPNAFPILAKMPYEEIVVNDIVSNDDRQGDEKLVKTSKNSRLDVGGYFYMDNYFWLIQHKDHREMNTMKTFTARKCNQFINHRYNGVVYKVPVAIEYMTMYTDGLQSVKYGTVQDSKRTIWMGSNEVTKTINEGKRLIVTNYAFEVTLINNYEANGLGTGTEGIIKALAVQTPLSKSDDLEDKIAHNEAEPIQVHGEIFGDDELYIASIGLYSIDLDNADHWICNNMWVDIITDDGGQCEITIPRKNCYESFGDYLDLSVCDSEGEVLATKTIRIRGV